MNIHEISQFVLPIAHAAEQAAVEHANGGVAALLGINWKLFLAQLVNFGIVLFALNRWVFKPLSAKLKERTFVIEKSLQQAEEIEVKHQQAEQDRLIELQRARNEAADIISKAEQAANRTKDEILAEARNQAEKLVTQTKNQLHEEKNKMMAEIREETANMVVMATEKILREKLDDKKDKHLIEESLKNI